MKCTRCDGCGIFYTKTINMQPIKAKPDDGMCYRCHGTGIEPYPHLFEETNNKTTMKEEDDIMTTTTMNATVNYKEMKWVDILAYAKILGINTGHKKRVQIEDEIETYFESLTEDNTVPVGDMSSDKYYPELQKEQPKEEIKPTKEIVQDKIIKAINVAKFNATYHNVPVTYIMTKSLNTIIKYNLAEPLRTEENIQKVISGMVKKNVLYKCNNKFYGVR